MTVVPRGGIALACVRASMSSEDREDVGRESGSDAMNMVTGVG